MGDGKRRAELQRSAPENVAFPGAAGSKEEVAALAARSDACLTLFKDVPVLATNSPNKLFDSFAAGRPAIVNMDGWMRELVEENEAGLYVRAGDARDLAAKLEWLRDHPDEAAPWAVTPARSPSASSTAICSRGACSSCSRRRRSVERVELSVLRRQHERPRRPARLPRRHRRHPP